MNDLQVVRKEFVLSRDELDGIDNYFSGYSNNFNEKTFEVYFKNYLLKVSIALEFLSNEVVVNYNLHKKDNKGNYIWLLYSEEKVNNMNDLLKLYKINIKKLSILETLQVEDNIDVLFLFHVEDIVKDLDFYDYEINRYKSMDVNQKHNILQYIDCNNKAELFQGLYFLIEEEYYYSNLFHSPIRTDEETLILKELKFLVDRLEYFGYEYDYYTKYKTLFEDKIGKFFTSGKTLNSDDILNYFMICVLDLINKGVTRGIPNKRKSDLYSEYYKQLEIEGFFKNTI